MNEIEIERNDINSYDDVVYPDRVEYSNKSGIFKCMFALPGVSVDNIKINIMDNDNPILLVEITPPVRTIDDEYICFNGFYDYLDAKLKFKFHLGEFLKVFSDKVSIISNFDIKNISVFFDAGMLGVKVPFSAPRQLVIEDITNKCICSPSVPSN